MHQTLLQLSRKDELDPTLYRRLNPSFSRAPCLYGLPKVHKPDIPLRPIVSTIGSATYDLAKHLAMIISPLAGQSTSFVKNSAHFTQLLAQRQLKKQELMVSFDVSSLFTKIPVDEALTIIQERLNADETLPERTNLSVESLMHLLKICLKTTYFVYDGNYYQQNEGAAMGSPLSPIIANIFMEFFEEAAIESATLKPSFWIRYVDDTFTLWPHGEATLHEFLNHLNSLRPTIKFTMEVESENSLPFLDVRVTRDPSTLTIKTEVYRKPTHTDRYLNFRSYHPPNVKHGIIRTLVHRAEMICSDGESLEREKQHLATVFKNNGYPTVSIRKGMHIRKKNDIEEDNTKAVTSIPYVRGVSEKIKRICSKVGIRVMFRSGRTLRSLLTKVKPRMDPTDATGVVYRIPCMDCDRSYIGETCRTLNVRLKEHQRCCRNLESQKSAVAQHAIEEDDRIDWDQSTVIDREQKWHTRRLKEALHIRTHNNFNQDQGLAISPIWHSDISAT